MPADHPSPLSGFSDDELVSELLARGTLTASVWNAEDCRSVIEEDETCSELTNEQVAEAALEFLSISRSNLVDAVSQRGNDYPNDAWSEFRDEVLASVATPKAGSSAP